MMYSLLSIYSLPIVTSFIFLIGLCVGSFLNVLIDRLPNEETIGGRSHCDNCKKTLSFFDLIPVFSFIFLKGKCRYCHKKLSIQYPFIEIITGVSFVLTWLYVDPLWLSLPGILSYFTLISACIVIVVADFKYHIIPDQATVAFIVASLLITNDVSMVDKLSGGVVLFLILLAIFLLSRGRMMGFGDVKLAFGMGILFGIHDGLIALYLSFLTGGIFSMGLLLTGASKMKSKIAFGPFMIAGTLLMMFYGREINEIIKRIF